MTEVYEEEVESEYFSCFQKNQIEKFSEIEDDAPLILQKFMKWAKGEADQDLLIDDIWNDKDERNKSNLDKISFTSLLVLFQFVQMKLKENEDTENVIEDILEKKGMNSKKEISQLFFLIDESELDSHIIEEILGEEFKNDSKKKEFVVEILVKFDFLLLKGRQKFDVNDKYAVSQREYLIPLLFPKHIPRLILRNDQNENENGKLSTQIEKKNNVVNKYYLPFKPSALWKMLFIRLRSACVKSEDQYKMLNEIYWMNGIIYYFFNFHFYFLFINKLKKITGFMFYFENVENKETTIFQLKFIETKEEKKNFGKEENVFPVIMSLNLRTNEDENYFLKSINNSIGNFLSGWIQSEITNEIKVKSFKGKKLVEIYNLMERYKSEKNTISFNPLNQSKVN